MKHPKHYDYINVQVTFCFYSGNTLQSKICIAQLKFTLADIITIQDKNI